MFRQWCKKVILGWRLKRGEVEFILGVLLGVFASAILIKYASPWWLFLSVPGGVTLCLPGYWWDVIRGNDE